jgi:hypothetical protein
MSIQASTERQQVAAAPTGGAKWTAVVPYHNAAAWLPGTPSKWGGRLTTLAWSGGE